METRSLTLSEFKELVVPAFRAVFRDADSFGTPFHDSVPQRVILYPVNYLFDSDQIDAMATAGSALGDKGFFVVGTERESHWRELIEHTSAPSTPRVSQELLKVVPPEVVRQTWATINRGDYSLAYDDDPAWYFSFDDLSPWKEGSEFTGATLETALVSESGRWGALISHESHAVVGGPREFIEPLLTEFPASRGAVRGPDGNWEDLAPIAAEDQVVSFLTDVKSHWEEPME